MGKIWGPDLQRYPIKPFSVFTEIFVCKSIENHFNQKCLFFAVSLYPLLFFTNTPFKADLKIWKENVYLLLRLEWEYL